MPSSRRTDSQQLVRQWAILKLLANSKRSFSVKDLADQLGGSKSTIQRDLATLEQHFALIDEDAGKQKKTFRIDEQIRALESITFGCLELLSIHAACAIGDALRGTPIAEHLTSVAQKIRGFLSDRHNGGLDAMARVFVPHRRGHVDYTGHADVIDDLTDAISRRLWIELSYTSKWKGTTKDHRIRPLRLLWHRSALYLLGSMEGYQDITTYAVHRIESLDVTADEFPPPKIDVDAHVQQAFGVFVSDHEEDVEIVFDESIAWRVEERTYHPDESKERDPDGHLIYRVRASAQWELIPWVMSFGPLAELKKPTSWRQVITDNLEAMREAYAPQSST